MVEQEAVEQPLVSKNVAGEEGGRAGGASGEWCAGCPVSSPAYPSYTSTWRPAPQNSFPAANSPGDSSTQHLVWVTPVRTP